MKKTILPWTFLLGFLFLSNIVFAQPYLQPKGDTNSDVVVLKTFGDSVAYAYGIMIAQQLKEQKINKDILKLGLDDIYAGKQMLTTKQSKLLLKANQKKQKELQKKRNEEIAKKNELNEREFLTNNADAAGVVTTTSGLQYKIIKEGNGKKPTTANKVKVNYEGKLLNAKVFDTTFKKGSTPAMFKLTQVIPGWTEGLQLMSEGSRFQFFIPSKLAYGVKGRTDIPPGSLLIFEVELLEIME